MFCLVKWAKTNAFVFPIGKMKLIKILNLFQPIEFSLYTLLQKMSLDTHFDGRYVTKPKIFSKQDRVIIFFPVKAEMLLFPNLKPRRPPGGLPKLYFGLKILHFFENFEKFQNFISK